MGSNGFWCFSLENIVSLTRKLPGRTLSLPYPGQLLLRGRGWLAAAAARRPLHRLRLVGPSSPYTHVKEAEKKIHENVVREMRGASQLQGYSRGRVG